MSNKKKDQSLFLIFSLATLVAILVELLPSGLLPEITSTFGIDRATGGNFTGYYALASAFTGIPTVYLTRFWDRKKVLLLGLVTFFISNLIFITFPIYQIGILARLLTGVAAGLFWGTTSVYISNLASLDQKSKAIAIGMGGSVFGSSFGLPIFTKIGQIFTWQIAFFIISVIGLLNILLVIKFLPKTPGENSENPTSPREVLSNKSLWVIIIATILLATANYMAYVYVSIIVDSITYPKGIDFALLIFGIGSISTIFLTTKYLDTKLRTISIMINLAAALAMGIFYFLGDIEFLNHLGFFAWGTGFAGLTVVGQALVNKKIQKGRSQGVSYQSASFNLSIMLGSLLGSGILIRSNIQNIILLAGLMIGLGVILIVLAKNTFENEG